MNSLRLHKARLSSESDLLRYQFHLWGQNLQQPVSAIETGFEFALVGADLLQITTPYRRAKPGRKWLTIPQVLNRFLRWRSSADD